MASARSYTPPEAPLAELRRLHAALGVERTVIVQPSFYGTDNSCLLDSLARYGNRARGVAVIEHRISDETLNSLHLRGVRGIRFNLAAGPLDKRDLPIILRNAASRIASFGWHIELNVVGGAAEALEDMLVGLPVPLVLDHFGGIHTGGLHGQPHFSSILALLDKGNTYVKLSGLNRIAPDPASYASARWFVRRLVQAWPGRMLWGSDWPHTGQVGRASRRSSEITPFDDVDDHGLLSQLAEWIDDARRWNAILVENPEDLYGFSSY